MGTQGLPRVTEIHHDPQLFVDDFLVDNRWADNHRAESVRRVFHQPAKHPANPVIAGDGGYVNVVRDDEAGLFRMWYQAYWDISYEPRKYTYAVAYAESPDGIHWKLPRIRRHSFKNTLDNNIVFAGPFGDHASCPFIVDAPEEDRRGYRYVMLHGTRSAEGHGMHLIGSHDGIEWDPASSSLIFPGYRPDTHSSILWDPRLRTYVCFTRATNLYDDTNGLRRRVARLEHPTLWDTWPIYPENILIPDELDERSGHPLFYGMPTQYYAGIYWGFLWPYAYGGDIHTELAFSRDGWNFQRLPERPRLVDRGPEGSWDAGMVFASTWLEVGDEWWLYYSGTDGGHNSRENVPGIGLARVRKEGFVSLRSPAGGGTVVTKLMRWPGGRLLVNADASKSEFTVLATGYDRKPIDGFDPAPSLPVTGDRVRHEVVWAHGDIRALEGKPIRLEFLMRGEVDLFGFQAVPEEA